MVATERFLAKLKKEGRQEGRQEGQEIPILKMYHKTGWSAQQIAECTDYSVEYIQSIIDKHEKAIIDAYKVKFWTVGKIAEEMDLKEIHVQSVIDKQKKD